MTPNNSRARHTTSSPLQYKYYDASPAIESPFTKRRRNSGDSLARWTTRAVLLSPLLILTFWSIIVVCTRKSVSATTTVMKEAMPPQGAVRVPVRPKHHNKNAPKRTVMSQFASNELFMDTQQQQPQQQVLVVQPPDLKTTDRHARPRPHPRSVHNNHADGKLIPIYVPLGQEQEQVVVLQQEESLPVVQETVTQNSIPVALNAIPVAQNSIPVSQNAIPVAQNSAPVTQNAIPVAQNSIPVTQNAIPVAQNSIPVTQNAIPVAQSTVENAIPVAQNTAVVESEPELMQKVVLQPRPKKQSAPKILYYDADASTVDGKLYMPRVVYDENGTEISLASLQSSTTDIYLEPPMQQEQTVQEEAFTEEAVVEQLQLAVPTSLENLNMTPVQDQYIIVATVAVMALLVGALSARRMRSRNFLSSCIENEAFTDDVAATDTQYSAAQGDYSTFQWRGDLEKFDV